MKKDINRKKRPFDKTIVLFFMVLFFIAVTIGIASQLKIYGQYKQEAEEILVLGKYNKRNYDTGRNMVFGAPPDSTVKVYFEKPVFGGFHSAECYLPSYEWKNIDGFSQNEINNLQEFLQSVAHIVIRLAREGGFDNAANF